MTEFNKNRTLSSDLKKHVGKKVLIEGWLHKVRELGGLIFVVVRDRKGLTQIVVDDAGEKEKLRGLQVGTVLRVEGKAVEEKRAAAGAEIHEPKISVVVPVNFPPPIEIDKPISHEPENLETLFDYKVVNMRNIEEQAIWKIQGGVKQAIREYLLSQDFTEFNSPKLLAGATEGGAEVFKLDYFGKEATLAQSAQFYKQIMVGALERVFEINPTYRAEPSMTTRHMTEFIHVDVEMGFLTSIDDLFVIAGGLLNFVVMKVWERYENELVMLKAVKPVLTDRTPTITLKELHEQYFKATGEDTRKEIDPIPAEERWSSEYSLEKFGSEAIFITEFPTSGMKFYHKIKESDPSVLERADLIFRGVEIATVPLREHRYEKLIAQMKAQKIDPEHPGFKYYLEAFKYGLPPHGGFGLGLERLTQKIIGLRNVKEATLFPRDINRLTP